MPTTSTVDSLGALEERVTGLERGQTAIIQSLDALAKEVRERQRIPWGGLSFGVAVVGILGAVVAFGVMAYINVITEAQNRLQTQINTVTTETVPRSELDARREQNRDNLDRMEAAIMKLTDAIVPRGEHAEHWRAQETADVNLQRQIDELRQQFGSAYSLSNALQDIQDRLTRLEQRELGSSQTLQ